MPQETNRKYTIIENETLVYDCRILYRIQALKDFANVKAGDKGGWVESYHNLSQEGDCWIYGNAKVYDYAEVLGDARISDEASVYNYACVCENTQVYGNACVFGNVKVYGHALISDYANVYSCATIYGYANVYDNASVYGHAAIYGGAHIYGHAEIYCNAEIFGRASVFDNTKIYDNAKVYGVTNIYGRACISGDAIIGNETDYCVFKNNWKYGHYFTYTKSNKMWRVDSFYGTGEELIKRAYQDSELSGKMYESYVNLVKLQEELEEKVNS